MPVSIDDDPEATILLSLPDVQELDCRDSLLTGLGDEEEEENDVPDFPDDWLDKFDVDRIAMVATGEKPSDNPLSDDEAGDDGGTLAVGGGGGGGVPKRMPNGGPEAAKALHDA